MPEQPLPGRRAAQVNEGAGGVPLIASSPRKVSPTALRRGWPRLARASARRYGELGEIEHK
jgi:hypothetical protein